MQGKLWAEGRLYVVWDSKEFKEIYLIRQNVKLLQLLWLCTCILMSNNSKLGKKHSRKKLQEHWNTQNSYNLQVPLENCCKLAILSIGYFNFSLPVPQSVLHADREAIAITAALLLTATGFKASRTETQQMLQLEKCRHCFQKVSVTFLKAPWNRASNTRQVMLTSHSANSAASSLQLLDMKRYERNAET